MDEKGRLEATMEEDCDGVSDDFSEEMLKQYLREEERRAQHQAALIKLREKALKDKAKAEMEYLDQLKAQNKGDADKMSTIKKRQRAVVIKLQEEQVTILFFKRLHERSEKSYISRDDFFLFFFHEKFEIFLRSILIFRCLACDFFLRSVHFHC